jgi:long-subunit fatty acid transport protein
MYFRLKRSLQFLIILLLLINNLHAQLLPTLGGQRAGTATAQFLKIGAGARAVSMGEAYVAVANDAAALYWNPAGIVQFNRSQFTFCHTNWPVGIQHEFVGYVQHINAVNSFGVSLTSLHTDDMSETTEFEPFGTGNYFTFQDLALSLTYARRMTDRFSFGVSFKYIEETLAELKMRGGMIDFGTFYWTGFGSTRFALVVTNFGPQLTPAGEFTRRDGKTVNEFQAFIPPTTFKVGFAAEIFENSTHRLTTSIQLNHPNDNSENINLGTEYAWRNLLAFRGGYKGNQDEESFTFGAGFDIPLNLMHFNFDYAYTFFGRLGSASRLSITIGF